MIFCDLDDVFADFAGYVERNFGYNGWDTPREKLWADVMNVEDYWLKLDVCKDSKKIWNKIKHLNPKILTGCPVLDYDRAKTQKPEWVAKNISADMEVICCLSKDKHFYCKNSDDILIDDLLVNINDWRKAGGIGIHHTDVETTLQELEKHLKIQENSQLEAVSHLNREK